MKLPESLNKLKKLGVIEEELELEGIKFVVRSVTSKEHIEVVATVGAFQDPDTKWEMTKQKYLEFAIKTVDGVPVDNAELVRFLLDCNPNIIDALFSKYLVVAAKAGKVVHEKIENSFELADNNLTSPLSGGLAKEDSSKLDSQNEAQ